MAIEPERIEAAARAMLDDPKLWDVAVESYRDEWRDRASDVLEAAYPELAAGTAWVAPWEATDEMASAFHSAKNRPGMMDVGTYRAMRDAHLSKGKDDDHG